MKVQKIYAFNFQEFNTFTQITITLACQCLKRVIVNKIFVL